MKSVIHEAYPDVCGMYTSHECSLHQAAASLLHSIIQDQSSYSVWLLHTNTACVVVLHIYAFMCESCSCSIVHNFSASLEIECLFGLVFAISPVTSPVLKVLPMNGEYITLQRKGEHTVSFWYS